MDSYIIGDVHAKFGLLNQFINKKNPEAIYILGDFGKETLGVLIIY